MSKSLSTTILVIGIVLALGIGMAGIFVYRIKTEAIRTIWQLEQEDPLFYFPGILTRDLREIGRTLESLNKSFAVEPRLRLENADLYPHRFWAAVADVAEAREEFYLNPTRYAARRLIAAEDAAMQRYAEHIDTFNKLWKKSITESAPVISPNHIFSFLTGTKTDIATFNETIKMIKENGQILDKEIRRRHQCLRFGLCPKFFKKIYENNIPDRNAADKIPPPVLLPDSYLSATRKLLPATELSPKYFEVETKCFGKTPELNWFLLWQRKYPDGTMALFPKLATNSFYRKLNPKHFLPQDAASVRAGFAYAWQPETNLYLCPDLEYYPKLVSLNAILERIAIEQLAAKLPASVSLAIRQKVAMEEKTIIRSQFLEEYMIDNYIGVLQSLLPSLADHSNLRRSVTTLIQSWDTKSLRTPDIFESLAVNARRYLTMVKIAAVPITPITTTLTHSYISLGYAVWNPSVWRLAEKPNFVLIYEPTEPLLSDTIVDYWHLQKITPQSTILKIQSATVEGVKILQF